MFRKIIALVLVTVFAAATFCGCKGNGKASSSVPNTASEIAEEIKVPTEIEVTKADGSQEWVYDAPGYKSAAYHVPHINIDSKDVEKLNAEIAEFCKNAEDKNEYKTVYYTFMEKGNLLSVAMSLSNSYGWEVKHLAYNISLYDGSAITDPRYMAAYLGLTDEEYRIAAATAVTNNFYSLFASFQDSNFAEFKSNLEKNQKEETTKTFTGFINERGELAFCGEMYGMKGDKQSFSCSSAAANSGIMGN